MFRVMLKSKIHRAVVTEANLNYVGSITIDQDLLDAANIWPNEKVHVVNNNNGARLETYVIAGERGSGVMCLNGAAARHAQPGDVIIVISYTMLPEDRAREYQPLLVFVDEKNKITEIASGENHGEIK